MTTGVETIHLVSGKTITYKLDLNERIIEAIGEVPEKPSLIDVMAFGVAAFHSVLKCEELKTETREQALKALQVLLDEAGVQHDGVKFF